MYDAKQDPPFPDACRRGRAFISVCCTAGTYEFSVDGILYLSTSVAGHGWFPAYPGRSEDINDTGTLVEAPGKNGGSTGARIGRHSGMAPSVKTAEEHACSMRFCHGEAARWRRQAGNVRAHADLPQRSSEANAAVLENAASCDAQGDWWAASAAADDRWWRAKTDQAPVPD